MALKYGGDRRKSEDVIRDSKTSGGLYDSYLVQDINTFKSHEGENKIRILPASWKEEDGSISKDWAYGVYLHYQIGPDRSAFLCAAKMKGLQCVICDARLKATDEDESYALKFNWRPHAFLIDRNNEKAGPLLWGMPVKQMFNEINARCIDRHTGEVLLIDHPEKGYDVFFDREGVKDRTKYKAVDIARDPSLLSRNEDNFWSEEDKAGNIIYGGAWLEFVEANPIPDLLVFHDQDYIASALYAKPLDKSERKSRSDEDEDRGSRRGNREREAEDIRGRRSRSDENEAPSRRTKSDEDEAPRRRTREDPEDKPKDDDPPRRRRLATEDDATPNSRKSQDEQEDAPRRRARETEDDPPRRRERSNGGGDEEDAFKPRSRTQSDEGEGDPTKEAKAALEDLKNERRSRS